MVLPCLYDDARYASERISDTVVRLLNGELIYVYNIPDINRATCYKLSDHDREITVSLKDLDISPLPLGWTLYGTDCHFLARRAVRRYKQGSCWNNVIGPRLDRYGGRSVRAYRIFETPVYNKYPDWRSARQMVQDAYDKVPLTRDFALDGNNDIWYRTEERPCGRFDPSDQRIYVDPRNAFLVESIEENLQHQAVVRA